MYKINLNKNFKFKRIFEVNAIITVVRMQLQLDSNPKLNKLKQYIYQILTQVG
jgi:hypothetical protein